MLFMLSCSSYRVLGSHLLGFFESLIDGADHVERLLWQRVALPIVNHLETANGFSQRHVLTGLARKDLSNQERMRQKSLHFASKCHV